MPARENKVQAYLDTLKAFSVFAEDANYARGHFDSISVDLNTPIPISWGGLDRNISFLIMPQCIRYSFIDYNYLEFSQGCGDYNYSSMRTHDLNITLSPVNDFNSMTCSFNGSGICPDNDYNSLSELPYFSVHIDSSQCSGCAIAQAAVRGHFNPGQESAISIICEGAICTSPPIDLNFSGKTGMRYSGNEISIAYAFSPATEIESMFFEDANISVEHKGFGSREWG